MLWTSEYFLLLFLEVGIFSNSKMKANETGSLETYSLGEAGRLYGHIKPVSKKHHVTSGGLLMLVENEQVQSSVWLWTDVQLRISSAVTLIQREQSHNCCSGPNVHRQVVTQALAKCPGSFTNLRDS